MNRKAQKEYTTLQITKGLAEDLKKFCSSRGSTMSGIAEVAIKNFITGSVDLEAKKASMPSIL